MLGEFTCLGLYFYVWSMAIEPRVQFLWALAYRNHAMPGALCCINGVCGGTFTPRRIARFVREFVCNYVGITHKWTNFTALTSFCWQVVTKGILLDFLEARRRLVFVSFWLLNKAIRGIYIYVFPVCRITLPVHRFIKKSQENIPARVCEMKSTTCSVIRRNGDVLTQTFILDFKFFIKSITPIIKKS